MTGRILDPDGDNRDGEPGVQTTPTELLWSRRQAAFNPCTQKEP